MPRQPFLRLVHVMPIPHFELGTRCIGQRPELEHLIGQCLIAWPHVEAEMTTLLGQLLGVDSEPALAVFQSLRRSTAKSDALSQAAKKALKEPADALLFNAILNVHKSVEAERNALAHGHFGYSKNLPDGILWMNTADYLASRVRTGVRGETRYYEKDIKALLASMSAYRADDLKKILAEINDMAHIWVEMIGYLRLATPDVKLMENLRLPPDTQKAERDRVYRQLCDRPRVRRELDRLRRENSPKARA
jgi:hypothetical protein